MQNAYQNDSIIDDSMSGSQNRSRQLSQEPSESRFISNRQKILNLHERIKMLDQIGNGSTQKKISIESLSKNAQQQVRFEDHRKDQDENLRKVASEKTFLRQSLTIKPRQQEADNQKPEDSGKFLRQKVQSPTHNHNNSSQNLIQQSSSPLQNNQTFTNNSNNQFNQSASRQPYNQSPKHNPFELQNISTSHYRPGQGNDLFPLENRYLSIEDKFLQFKMSEENLLGNIDGEIRELQENCKQLKKDYEKTEKRNQDVLQNIEKSLAAEINDLSVELKQVKKGAIESLDTKHKAIRCETIAMIAQDFESQCKLAYILIQSRSTQIQTHLEGAHRLLQKQENLRDETAEFLINSFGDEIIKLEEVLNVERQSRIRRNDELLKMINSVEDKLMDKIQREKRQMLENIEAMENMLEQVCYKIEQKILGN